ncbi:hypothetical protein QOZ80_5AG0380560 [Eleusine coracana subsp. coracana]|nr:hypothetical protein QOZ80_5AG0380560 [Eleusine coracana subsp. coracana]
MDTNPDPATLAKAMDARKSVVTVFVEKKRTDGTVIDGHGSGFIVKSRGGRGIVLTCYHVLRGSETLGFDKRKDKIFIRGMCGKAGIPWQAQGRLIEMHQFADLAIVKVIGIPKEVKELKFVASDALPVGTCAIAVGYSNPDDVFRQSDAIILTTVPAVSPGAIRYVL